MRGLSAQFPLPAKAPKGEKSVPNEQNGVRCVNMSELEERSELVDFDAAEEDANRTLTLGRNLPADLKGRNLFYWMESEQGTSQLEVMVASEAAKYVRLGTAALYELTRRNNIPHVRIGRRYRYLRSQLDEWLLSGGTSAHEQARDAQA